MYNTEFWLPCKNVVFVALVVEFGIRGWLCALLGLDVGIDQARYFTR